MTNVQAPNPNGHCFIGYWDLIGFWDLVIGTFAMKLIVGLGNPAVNTLALGTTWDLRWWIRSRRSSDGLAEPISSTPSPEASSIRSRMTAC